MYTEIAAAFQSAKTAVELLNATRGLSNYNEVLSAVNDVQIKLSVAIASALASQEKEAALAKQVRELETRLRDIEDWKSLIQRYALFEFPTKALAFRLKPEMANDEPMHYLCTACADKKKKSTLQLKQRWLYCPECKFDIEAQEPPPRSDRSGSSSWKTV